MSRPGARAANRFSRLVQSEPLVLRMLRSEFNTAIVARPSGWLTSTFRMAICRDTHNSTPQRETASNVVLPRWAVYGLLRFSNAKRNIEKRPQRGMELRPFPTGRAIGGKRAPISKNITKSPNSDLL